MENGTPPLFRQGIPDGVRFSAFAFLAMVLMLVDGKLQTLEAFRGVIARSIVQPAGDAAMAVCDSLLQGTKFFTTVSALSDENAELRRRNAELSAQVTEIGLLREENSMLLAANRVKQSISAETAVGLLAGGVHDTLTAALEIRLGEENGVRPGMPVFDEEGVIGQIFRVWDKRSEVVRLDSPGFKMPVLLARTSIHCVAAASETTGMVSLDGVPASAGIIPGDLVETSGIDGIFPPHLLVGFVTAVDQGDKNSPVKVTVELSARPRQGSYAVVALTPDEAPRPESEETGGGSRR